MSHFLIFLLAALPLNQVWSKAMFWEAWDLMSTISLYLPSLSFTKSFTATLGCLA